MWGHLRSHTRCYKLNISLEKYMLSLLYLHRLHSSEQISFRSMLLLLNATLSLLSVNSLIIFPPSMLVSGQSRIEQVAELCHTWQLTIFTPKILCHFFLKILMTFFSLVTLWPFLLINLLHICTLPPLPSFAQLRSSPPHTHIHMLECRWRKIRGSGAPLQCAAPYFDHCCWTRLDSWQLTSASVLLLAQCAWLPPVTSVIEVASIRCRYSGPKTRNLCQQSKHVFINCALWWSLATAVEHGVAFCEVLRFALSGGSKHGYGTA